MKVQRADELIDISDWEIDLEFSPYPEGSRSKYAVYCPPKAGFDFLVPKHRYLFKHSNPNFPAQFWAEIIAYRIGCRMGVRVPPAFAAVNTDKAETAALIEWFYGPDLEPEVPERAGRLDAVAKFIYRRIFGECILD